MILGAAIAWIATPPQRLIASIMPIGAGVQISTVTFDLMDEAFHRGGFDSTTTGFLGAALVYSAANIIVSQRGGKHRRRSGSNLHESQSDANSDPGAATAIGALLDGIG